MADGDAQRVWFPEVIEELRSQWQEGLGFQRIIGLRNDLDAILQRVRSETGITSPFIRCRRCGYAGPRPAPHVSVRAMILSLTKFGIAEAEPVYALEKGWAAYRRELGLDIYGICAEPKPDQQAICDHLPGK
jgi:hypothetical protein